jgi:hypothetical protein
MIHGRNISPTATAAETWKIKAWLAVHTAAVLQSNRKKSTQERTHKFVPKLVSLCPEPRKRFHKAQNSKNVSCI